MLEPRSSLRLRSATLGAKADLIPAERGSTGKRRQHGLRTPNGKPQERCNIMQRSIAEQTMKAQLKPFAGKWSIVEMEAWDQEYVNENDASLGMARPKIPITIKSNNLNRIGKMLAGGIHQVRVVLRALDFYFAPQPFVVKALPCAKAKMTSNLEPEINFPTTKIGCRDKLRLK